MKVMTPPPSGFHLALSLKMKLDPLLLSPTPWIKIMTEANPPITEVKQGDAARVGLFEEATLVALHATVGMPPAGEMAVAGEPLGVTIRVNLPLIHSSSEGKTPYLESPDSRISR